MAFKFGYSASHITGNNTTWSSIVPKSYGQEIEYAVASFVVLDASKWEMYTDTLFAKVKSIRSNTCEQDWTDGNGYTLFYPLRSKQDAYSTVSMMVGDMRGIPEVIVSDNSGEQTGAKWMAEIRHFRSRHHLTEPFSPWQNRAERDIQEVKRGIKRATRRGRSPKRLWDYCGQTAHDNPVLDGLAAEEFVHARTPDIFAYSMFDWYEPVWFIDPAKDAAQSWRVLGRWIGVAEGVGSSQPILSSLSRVCLLLVRPFFPSRKMNGCRRISNRNYGLWMRQ
jgi:hypothetical protein